MSGTGNRSERGIKPDGYGLTQYRIGSLQYQMQRENFYKALTSIPSTAKNMQQILESGIVCEAMLADRVNGANIFDNLFDYVDFIQSATHFINTVQRESTFSTEKSPEDSRKAINQSLIRLMQAAERSCARLPSNCAAKFFGAVVSLIGDLIAILTLGQVTCVAKTGHSIFSGYRSKINQFTDALVTLNVEDNKRIPERKI